MSDDTSITNVTTMFAYCEHELNFNTSALVSGGFRH